MTLSLARPVLRQSVLSRTRAIQSVRNVHIENKLGNVRDNIVSPSLQSIALRLLPQNMPFDYSNKRTFAIKVAVFLSTGFAIPFVAAAIQLYVLTMEPS